MSYPCFVFSRSAQQVVHADNAPYHRSQRYQVTYIDRDPDPESGILEKVADLPLCAFERHFVVDNLNHDIFNIYF